MKDYLLNTTQVSATTQCNNFLIPDGSREKVSQFTLNHFNGYWNKQILPDLYSDSRDTWICIPKYGEHWCGFQVVFSYIAASIASLFAVFQCHSNLAVGIKNVDINLGVVNIEILTNVGTISVILFIILSLFRMIQVCLFLWLYWIRKCRYTNYNMQNADTSCTNLINIMSQVPTLIMFGFRFVLACVCPLYGCFMLEYMFNLLYLESKTLQYSDSVSTSIPMLPMAEKYIDWLMTPPMNHESDDININLKYDDQLQFDEYDYNYNYYVQYKSLVKSILNVQLTLFYLTNVPDLKFPYSSQFKIELSQPQFRNKLASKTLSNKQFTFMITPKWRKLYSIEVIIDVLFYLYQACFILLVLLYSNTSAFACGASVCALLVHFGLFLLAVKIRFYENLANAEMIFNNVDAMLLKYLSGLSILDRFYAKNGRYFIYEVFFGKNNINRDKIRDFIQAQLFYDNPNNLCLLMDNYLQSRCQSLNATYMYHHIPMDIVNIIIEYIHSPLTGESLVDFVFELHWMCHCTLCTV